MARKKRIKDPLAAEEAKRYENPIPSRECILNFLEEAGQPLTYDQLIVDLGLRTPKDQEALNWRLLAMVRDGQLVKLRHDKFALIDKLDLIRGYVIGHPDGHGFLVPEDNSGDLFLSHKQMRQVFDGDQVLGRVVKYRYKDKREAVIVRVLKRRHKQITGRFFTEGGINFVVPDNKRLTQDIVIPAEEVGSAKQGEVVVAEITAYPTVRAQAIGRIADVLGGHMSPGMETDVAVRAHDIPYIWPEEVEKESATIPDEVLPSDLNGREDLRQLAFVTIDGDDARDFDDAVYCEPTDKGWRLLVAIADVSHYVKPNTALDREALNRGNSTYFPTRVIPMLPEKLSNGLCSLNPQVDRLVMVCDMQINQQGKMTAYQFYPGVIHSQARLTYDKVAAMLVDDDKSLQQQYQEVYPHLQELFAVYHALHKQRHRLGAIDFDISEPKVIFDQDKKIKTLIPSVRNEAHRLIEECMLSANVAAAKFMLEQLSTGIFRIHPGPKLDRLEELLVFLGEIGLSLGGGLSPTTKDYAKLLQEITTRPDKHLIQTILLRSLTQAQYSAENTSHFGLAFDEYAHFTSPIRRYPDLVVHRLIKAILAKSKPDKEILSHLPEVAAHCSMTERRSDEAARDVMSWLKCEFMLDKVGEDFAGVISSVTSFGFFVELQNIYVEGLVHISNLDNDYYHYDAIHHRLTGRASGQEFCIGDTVRIIVAHVDLDKREIDFELVKEKKKSTSKQKPKPKQKQKKSATNVVKKSKKTNRSRKQKK